MTHDGLLMPSVCWERRSPAATAKTAHRLAETAAACPKYSGKKQARLLQPSLEGKEIGWAGYLTNALANSCTGIASRAARLANRPMSWAAFSLP